MKKKKKKRFKKNSAILGFEPPNPTTKSSPLTTTLFIESFEKCFYNYVDITCDYKTPEPSVFTNTLILYNGKTLRYAHISRNRVKDRWSHQSKGNQTIQRFWKVLRPVAGQRSSPESCLACIWRKTTTAKQHTLKIAWVWGCSIFWPPVPSHGMHPGVNSYGMEADPQMFLCLKYESFLMTD